MEAFLFFRKMRQRDRDRDKEEVCDLDREISTGLDLRAT